MPHLDNLEFRVAGIPDWLVIPPAPALPFDPGLEIIKAPRSPRPHEDHSFNVFDPWARDRGEYYTLEWRARAGAESDEAFKGSK